MGRGLAEDEAAVSGGGPIGGAGTGEGAAGEKTIPGVHPFDAEYGTDTSGLIPGETLNTGSRSDLWNTAYYGIPPSSFNQMMEALGAEFGSEWERFTFVDLGSGKGRALLLASRFPFRKIVGVELSAVAAANIKLMAAPWQRCREMEAICADAATFDYPMDRWFSIFTIRFFHRC
jgi:SAM-dependent methyltransferase